MLSVLMKQCRRHYCITDENNNVGGVRSRVCFFFSSRRRHTRFDCDWSSDVCSSDLEDHPLRQLALKNDLAMIRHFDHQILQVEEELQRQTKQVSSREYALLQTVPEIGRASCRERV